MGTSGPFPIPPAGLRWCLPLFAGGHVPQPPLGMFCRPRNKNITFLLALRFVGIYVGLLIRIKFAVKRVVIVI